MEKNKKRNELSIFEEFRIKPKIKDNKRFSQHFPKDHSLKKLNVLCEVDKKNNPISWWKKIRDEIRQVNEFGEIINEDDDRYQSKVPSEQKLLKNKSKVLVTVNEHNLIKDYWIKTKEGSLVQVNIKEKKDFDLDIIFKKWLRDKAIDQVGHEIRSFKKKAYEYNKKELQKIIEKEEKKIIKKNTMKGLRIAAFSSLGLSWIPFI